MRADTVGLQRTSLTCTVTTADPVAYPAPSPDEAVVMCRSEFVIGPGS